NTALDYRSTTSELYTSVDLRHLVAGSLDLDLQHLEYKSKLLRLDSADFILDNGKAPHQRKGMDYSHLRVSDLSLHGEDLAYNSDSASGRITKGELDEKSGFRLSQLQTRFFYSDKRLALADLYLRTPGTVLQRQASLQCDSLAGML